jgi:hypothetical protein
MSAVAQAAAAGAAPTHDWPAHHTVALLPGSLPRGGMVADTPVHAFARINVLYRTA